MEYEYYFNKWSFSHYHIAYFPNDNYFFSINFITRSSIAGANPYLSFHIKVKQFEQLFEFDRHTCFFIWDWFLWKYWMDWAWFSDGWVYKLKKKLRGISLIGKAHG